MSGAVDPELAELSRELSAAKARRALAHRDRDAVMGAPFRPDGGAKRALFLLAIAVLLGGSAYAMSERLTTKARARQQAEHDAANRAALEETIRAGRDCQLAEKLTSQRLAECVEATRPKPSQPCPSGFARPCACDPGDPLCSCL